MPLNDEYMNMKVNWLLKWKILLTSTRITRLLEHTCLLEYIRMNGSHIECLEISALGYSYADMRDSLHQFIALMPNVKRLICIDFPPNLIITVCKAWSLTSLLMRFTSDTLHGLDLIQSFPQLKILDVSNISYRDNDILNQISFDRSLPSPCLSMTSLYLCNCDFSLQYLKYLPNLKELHGIHFQFRPIQEIDYIASHCPQLRKITIALFPSQY